VNNSVCKVFKEAIVSVDEQYIYKLKNANIEDALTFSNVIIMGNKFHEKSTQSGCSPTTVRSDNNNERIRLNIGASIVEGPLNSVYTHWEARPFVRVLGIWFHCKREISCSIDMKTYYQSAVDGKWVVWNTSHINLGETASVLEDGVYVDFCVLKSGLKIVCYHSWAKQANTNKAYAICN
jgi:hypothetical protein